MGPEDVAFVLWNVFCELLMFEGAELAPVQVEWVDINTLQVELFHGPLNPMLHVRLIPV